MGRIGIQYLEQRFELAKEYAKLEKSVMNVHISSFGTLTSAIERYILDFPLNITSRDIDEYLSDRGIESSVVDFNSYILYRMNLYYNFLSWFYDTGVINKYPESVRKDIRKITSLAYRSMSFILSGLNYKAEFIEEHEKGFKLVSFIKRDADIDSVLPYVEKEIRIDILSYLDFRIENDLIEKEAIMGRLYKDLESKIDELNVDPFKNLFSITKRSLNFARHVRSETYSDRDRIEICDKAFYLYLHLIRSPKIKQFQNDLKDLPQ